MIYRFNPILKHTIWGGNEIPSMKSIDVDDAKIGESWEISAVPGSESVVSDGDCAGLTLGELVSKYGTSLLGESVVRRFGPEFPLLIKFIDAQQDLSIQVHPNDVQAVAQGKGSRGKTEMWYVLDAKPQARLLSGLKKVLTKEEYADAVANHTVVDNIRSFDVSRGDVFFLPAGCVHSIGAGCLIAEIQQSSDLTYRIYDYDRRDDNGQPRQLHTELAKEVIDFSTEDKSSVQYDRNADECVELVKCEYFRTGLYELTRHAEVALNDVDSFVVVMCVDGCGVITDSDGCRVEVKRGDSVLVAASTQSMTFEPVVAPMTLLVTTV